MRMWSLGALTALIIVVATSIWGLSTPGAALPAVRASVELPFVTVEVGAADEDAIVIEIRI